MFQIRNSHRLAKNLLSLVLICLTMISTAPNSPASASPPSYADTVRFLEQTTFGPTPGLVSHVQLVGFDAFLEEQFNAPVSSYPDLPLMPYAPTSACKRNPTCNRDNYTMHPLQTRFYLNALYEPDQLRQRVAFALHQILVVSGREVTLPSWMVYYLKTIDGHAFGNYQALLHDITLNPAMGDYLDMAGNTKANPNENYAREILQLFSIGLDQLNLDGTPQLDATGQRIPTYDQSTITGFARVFTGWELAPRLSVKVYNYKDPMIQKDAYKHHTGTKTLLNGVVLPAGQTAQQDLTDALDNIYSHPNVAPFICKQLIQHLVTSNPSPAYVGRVATVFNEQRASPTQLRSVVKAVLLDPEARGDLKTDPNYGQLRQPVLFITNILRAFNATSADGSANSDGYLHPQSAAMGQDLFNPPSVFSYYRPDYEVPGSTGITGPEFGLLSTATALKRINFASKVVFSRIEINADAPAGTSLDLSSLQALADDPPTLVETLNQLLLHGTMPEPMSQIIRQAVADVPSSQPLLRAQTAVYLVVTSSVYQVKR